MLDFVEIVDKIIKQSKGMKVVEIGPSFKIIKSNHLMVQGRDYLAIYDEETGLWSKQEGDVIRIIDAMTWDKYNQIKQDYEKNGDPDGCTTIFKPMMMIDSDSGIIDKWHKYVQKQLRDNYHQLDSKIRFSNSVLTREDYATKVLPYSMEEGSIEGYDTLMSVLYSQEERDKLEWAIGCIIAGDSPSVDKCIVLYGKPGSGKSTVLNIIEKIFSGYWSNFNAKLVGSGDSFALEGFKNNPLVAIQHDGDLSDIEDNTLLNSIISHEWMEVNEKFKSKYNMKFDAFIFMGTNKPVMITDAKSGLLRRVLDVSPTGEKVPRKLYDQIMGSKIDFELGAIAYHCFNKYKSMGKTYYDAYRPTLMMSETNDFFNFMETKFYEFSSIKETHLGKIYADYIKFCEMANIKRPLKMSEVRGELKSYFDEYIERGYIDGERVRSIYRGFKTKEFDYKTHREKAGLPEEDYTPPDIEYKIAVEEGWLNLRRRKSIFDLVEIDYPAQLANDKETPTQKWSDVTTTLKDIDTSKLHYVKVPQNHIVIDFDIKDENGNKSFELNKEAALKWPKTYAEISKGGEGIHLHYIYNGDVTKLSRVYDDAIEVKVFLGKSSLRRKLTKCNDIPIATINSGLPLKEENKVINFDTVKNEKALRTMIKKNLNKEYHGYTKPSIDFIYSILEEAYNNKDLKYDVSDLKQAVIIFASMSSNQSDACLKTVAKMHFRSEEEPEAGSYSNEAPIVFYDCEVFPNLFLINWKFLGKENKCVRMINPTPEEVRQLMQYRLVGFNCRRYDNHILYARMLGYTNYQLYELSQKIVQGDRGSNALFLNAYNLSYTDIYDYAVKKQSLKLWEIELGIHHQELGLPWDQPVDEDKWELVAEYCDNDVIATEAVWEATKTDFKAREIIAALSGLTVNDTTNSHSAKIIFGNDRNPQSQFIYTDLSTIFPGYKFEAGKSTYMGEEVGEGGWVYFKPGMYWNVWTFDVYSMHPHSAKELCMFGPVFTNRFYSLVEVRGALKHGELDKAAEMFDGKLKPYLDSEENAADLSNALKIVINSVYGLTSAKFNNKFRDPRNIDNICAKRGALFMITLKHELEKRGANVIHVKTDSIKVVDPSEEIKQFVYEFGEKYGYKFEVEDIFEKICLVNGSTYIAKHAPGTYNEKKHSTPWSAKAAQFAVPYVFKTLFSHEKIVFEDLCETKSVKSAMYLDMNEDDPENHNLRFVGKVGQFCPILPGHGAGLLVAERTNKNTGEKKYDSVTGTKGYRWLESESVRNLKLEDHIDKSYYISQVDDAVASISQYGDFENFVS